MEIYEIISIIIRYNSSVQTLAGIKVYKNNQVLMTDRKRITFFTKRDKRKCEI